MIDHTLYWSPVDGAAEAGYLLAILNSPMTTELVAPMQSQGLLGARHFDKYVWHLPIPEYDDSRAAHRRLATLGGLAEHRAAAVDLDATQGFRAARRAIRQELADLIAEADGLVAQLLGVSPSPVRRQDTDRAARRAG